MMRLSNQHLLGFILLAATIVRFYNYPALPLTHDEFSALFRTRFNSFSALISGGVLPDGHPAGVQVFLYYWKQLVGKTPWLLKLPFTLGGVISTGLMYALAKRWHGTTAALLGAALMAVLQYPVMYSQLARPYSPGLLFTLLMLLFWSRLVQEPHKHFTRNILLFAFSAALCAYTHHFSMLVAFITGLAGLFIIPRRYRRGYVLGGLLAIALYLPHAPLTIKQLQMGGLGGWLGKPGVDFPVEYLGYVFHYSVLLAGFVLVISAAGLHPAFRQDKGPHPYRLWLAGFLLPMIIGFAYSHLFGPVLQFSVLLFSFPFLLLLLFGHIRPQRPAINAMLTAVLLLAGIYTLVEERQHYRLLYRSPYKALLQDHQHFRGRHPQAASLVHSHKPITRHFAQKNGADTLFTWLSQLKSGKLASFISQAAQRQDTLYLGALYNTPAYVVPLIQSHFPHLIEQNNYYHATSYLFSKKGGASASPFSATLDFEGKLPEGLQGINQEQIVADTLDASNHIYQMKQSMTDIFGDTRKHD